MLNAKKFKVFLFAPKNEQLEKLLEQHNNVREARYITPYESVPYMRVRVRKFSNGVVGIARQFAASAGPIVEYTVGHDIESDKQVATIRIPEPERFDEVVALAEKFCKKVWKKSFAEHKADASKPELFFTCRVSKVTARTEKANSWVEVFAVEKHAVPREVWQAAVISLAQDIGGEAIFYNAIINEY